MAATSSSVPPVLRWLVVWRQLDLGLPQHFRSCSKIQSTFVLILGRIIMPSIVRNLLGEGNGAGGYWYHLQELPTDRDHRSNTSDTNTQGRTLHVHHGAGRTGEVFAGGDLSSRRKRGCADWQMGHINDKSLDLLREVKCNNWFFVEKASACHIFSIEKHSKTSFG